MPSRQAQAARAVPPRLTPRRVRSAAGDQLDAVAERIVDVAAGDAGNIRGDVHLDARGRQAGNQGRVVAAAQGGVRLAGGTEVGLDAAHCGSCEKACKTAETCFFGECSCTNDGYSTKLCGGVCTDISSDLDNCGDCGVQCPEDSFLCAVGYCF